MNVRIHIESVIVEGVALEPGSERHIRAALEEELTSLLRTNGLPALLLQGGAVPLLDGGQAPQPTGSTSEGVGRDVARSIYGSLSRGS